MGGCLPGVAHKSERRHLKVPAIGIRRKKIAMKLVEKSVKRLLLFGGLLAAITMLSGSARAQQAAAPTGDNDVTAIDTLLDPDATMIQHATAANAQLLKVYPKGFTLGGVHTPHISMLQRYGKTA